MRIASRGSDRDAAATSLRSDLTARTRLRDAAIDCFAATGFDASVRTIAERAGVSAGLIRHHFGSKDALRQECDAAVLDRLRKLKLDGVEAAPAALFARLTGSAAEAVMLVYILRSVHAGGEIGRTFIERMIADAVEYSARAVESGVLKPSRDPAARARYLVTSSIGGLVLEISQHPEIDLADAQNVLQRVMTDTALPTIELYTEGIFTSDAYLEEYLRYRNGPPATTTDASS